MFFSMQGQRKNVFHGQVDLPGRNSGMVEHGFIGASMGIQHQTWGLISQYGSIWIFHEKIGVLRLCLVGFLWHFYGISMGFDGIQRTKFTDGDC